MVNIEDLFKERKISRIPELELDRYENFFVSSYQDNLAHSKANLSSFPRWSIISGYYSMHDISKYLLAKQFRIKVRQDVHATTIKLIKDVVANRELPVLLEEGYRKYESLAEDLNRARKQRVRVQYYTGSAYMKELYAKEAEIFSDTVVSPYIMTIEQLTGIINEPANNRTAL